MTSGYTIYDLYGATLEFCNYEVAIRRTRWWQFLKRKRLREAQWFYYPIMVNELTAVEKLQDNKE